ncbi:MAG: hypothetical protein ACFFCM_18270 [Promethearchaeota archaeon]
MVLSYIGWIDGISAMGILIFGTIFGLFFFYKSRKLKLPLLSSAGLLLIFVALLWLGPTCDFFSVSLTGKNLDPILLYPILSYIWAGPAIICASYIFAELIIPKRKVMIITIYIILCIIFELYLFLDTRNSFIFNPYNQNEDLIDVRFALGSPAFILIGIIQLSTFIFGLVYIYRGFQRTGILRKKYFYIGFAFILFVLIASFDTFFSPGLLLALVRVIMISNTWLMYYGLREEPEKIEKAALKKEVEIKESLFRIAKGPGQITEEEVSISKEKKICLVCKGKVSGFETFLCPICETFYCHKCIRALVDQENMCWACNTPIDKSKPVKPFKKEEIKIKIPENPEKKQNSNKNVH